MPTDDPNIELLLDFSKQQDELIAGHQKEMSQVLANKEHLRVALAHEHKGRMAAEAEIIELKKQIALLQTENRELRNRPNIVTDTYIETQNVKQQCNYLPHSRRTSRYKLNNSTQTQLQLWNAPTATSM
ncbi:MAG: hypothetical protein J6A13_06785 [Paludibacteraceae bacterium]|nr:hypothetical protein [Paludibacteraceae bacterium]